MFTGIVEATGEVAAIEATGDGRRLRIAAPFGPDLTPGASVSVDGACLTVETIEDDTFEVFLAAETIERTALGGLAAGAAVNLERPLPADGRFDGHLVQGHVDATTEIIAAERVGEDWRYEFALPESLAPYVVEKGSVAIDGISLTVAGLTDRSFAVAIIPTTHRETTIGAKGPGDPVNVEVDLVAKYVERLLDGR